MTDKELRELDAWIAEHVMGWKMTEHPDDVTPQPSRQICVHRNDGLLVSTPYPLRDGYGHQWERYRPTEFSSDAMEVLKKCAEREPIITTQLDSGRFCVTGKDVETECVAPTLELAICLFAKKLFSK